MKKNLFVTLGICLFSFPLLTSADEPTNNNISTEDTASITQEYEEDFSDINNDEEMLTPAKLKTASTINGYHYLIKKEIPITNRESDVSTNGKKVNSTGTSLDLSGGKEFDTYLRFSEINLPKNTTIKTAKLIFTAKTSSKNSTTFTVQGEIGSNSPFNGTPDSFSSRMMSDNQIVVTTPDKVAINETLETDDLSAIIEEMLSHNNSLNDLVFKIKGNQEGKFNAKSFESSPEMAPKLVLEYESNTNEISIPIESADNSAQEAADTTRVTTTGNLAFGGESTKGQQLIGLRFNQVDLPENAAIEEAYIEFVTATTSKKPATSTVRAYSEIGHAEAYKKENGHISNRHYGKLKTETNFNQFQTKNETIRTNNLANIINENRLLGWQEGQSLGFKLEGDAFLGHVYSFDKTNSPRLVIKYQNSDNPITFDDVITDAEKIKGVSINEISTEGTVASKESWIELYNDNEKPVLLNSDISLVNKKKKFTFSNFFIPAKSHRVLYMDAKPELGNDHASFELSNSGNLSLVNNKRVIDSIDYTKHKYNQTVGRKPDGALNVVLINEPTFETSNNQAKTDSDLTFSHERGLYPSAFNLTLGADSDLTIRYTTDGTDPTPTNGTIYKSPISIKQTTVVKAMAYNDNSQTGVIAHSYVLEDNYQNEKRSGKQWQYKDSITSKEYATGLKQFPIISVTGNQTNLTKTESNGTFEYIDTHTPTNRGNYFSLSGNKKFGQVSSNQYNSGVAVKFNRSALTKKAKYSFFEETPNDPYPVVKKFAKLELKEGQDGPQNDIYGLGYNRYDEKVTNTLAKEMGKISLDARYVHYFYNGTYFGVKTLREDFGEKMFEEYFGGNDDDYTKIRFQDAKFSTGFVSDKESIIWPTINKSVTSKDFQKAKQYIDFDDLITTQILFMFVDTEREIDAVVQNSVLENDPKATKMKFNVNDTDGAFHNNNKTGTGQAPLAGGGGTYRYKWNSDARSKEGPGKIFGAFSGNSTNANLGNLEFKTMVKDRVAKQFGQFSDEQATAPLSVENVQKLINENINELDDAYKLDAAYMSARKDMYQNWKTQQEKILNQVPDRVNFSQEMWLKYNMAHTLTPVNIKEKDNQLTLLSSDKNVTIYYTTDGSDPMGNDGVVSKSAVKYSGEALSADTEQLTIRAFQSNNWGPLSTRK